MQQNAPQLIPVNKLADHPQNPRIALREDVVDAISANLTDGFDAAHALIVRPHGDVYQIISGHHRKAAAAKSGIEAVPCWVREMDDETAYMALATSNSQGELSPLEIGLHALGLDMDKRGKGAAGGGLKGYAALVGRAPSTVTECRQAASVAVSINSLERINDLADKSKHLAAIHALPPECWPDAVQTMLDKGWSAKETGEQVKAANEAGSAKVVCALLAGRTSLREIERIKETRERVAASFEYDETRTAWTAWFDEADPIDIKDVQAKRTELEGIEYARREKEREDEEKPALTKPNLVLADPPWRYDFAETDSRQIENQYPSATVDEIISHRPETQPDCVLFMWATVAKLREAFEVLDGWGFEYKTHAVWDKEKIGMGYWFRGQHELLLVGTKGKASPPDQDKRVSSVFREARGKHSEKPQCVYQWIESAFSDAQKLEMYCRKPRAGWLVFGNEAT